MDAATLAQWANVVSMNQQEKSIEAASQWNRELARQVNGSKRWRLSMAVLLAVAGLVVSSSGSNAFWSVPCFLAALILYFLYLDARDQVRVIRARHWSSITPRISRLAPGTPEDASQATSSR